MMKLWVSRWDYSLISDCYVLFSSLSKSGKYGAVFVGQVINLPYIWRRELCSTYKKSNQAFELVDLQQMYKESHSLWGVR
jgi:hypothetical protein